MKFPTFLRVAILTNMDLFIVNTTVEENIQITGGLESKFLWLLSKGLNFTFNIHIPEDKEWGRVGKDGEWTGVIGLVSRNEADIGISKLGITNEKMSAVDFSYPYSTEKVTFATRPPDVLSKETAIIRPFSKQVWLAFVVSFFSTVFALKIVFRNKYTLQYICFSVFGCFLQKSKILKSENCSERIMLSTFMWCVMLLSSSYTAVLLSFLTFPFLEEPVDNTYRLQEAMKTKHYKCVTSDGSSVLKTLLHSEDETTAFIANQIEEHKWFISPTKEVLINSFIEKNIAVINPENHFRIIPKNEILISKDSFFLLHSGIAVNKRFCCMKALDLMMRRILESGLYQKSEKDFYFQSRLRNMKLYHNVSPTKKTLELNDVVGAFILLLIGYLISITALFIELITEKKLHSAKRK